MQDMANSIKDLYKLAALTHLIKLIMMGCSVKALYKLATRSGLTVLIMTSSGGWSGWGIPPPFYPLLPPP